MRSTGTVPTIVPETRQNSVSRAYASQLARISEVEKSRRICEEQRDGRNADLRLANRCMGRSRSSPQHFKFRRIDARRSLHRASSNAAAILEKPVSDRGTLEDLSQSRISSLRVCKLLILNGEMSEWSIEHAWKAKPSSDTKQLQEAQRTPDQRISLQKLSLGVSL